MEASKRLSLKPTRRKYGEGCRTLRRLSPDAYRHHRPRQIARYDPRRRISAHRRHGRRPWMTSRSTSTYSTVQNATGSHRMPVVLILAAGVHNSLGDCDNQQAHAAEAAIGGAVETPGIARHSGLSSSLRCTSQQITSPASPQRPRWVTPPAALRPDAGRPLIPPPPSPDCQAWPGCQHPELARDPPHLPVLPRLKAWGGRGAAEGAQCSHRHRASRPTTTPPEPPVAVTFCWWMGSLPNRWRALVRPERLDLYTCGKSPPGQAAFPQPTPLLFGSARPVGPPTAPEAVPGEPC